jgi:tRNA CCA-adding enzyme
MVAKKRNSIQSVLKKQITLVRPRDESIKYLEGLTRNFINALNNELKRSGTNAEAFVGGSFARGTLIRSEIYDIDIFVRFDWRYEKISEILYDVLKNVCKSLNLKLERIHGSRDYYKIYLENQRFSSPSISNKKKVEGNVDSKGYFELIPVTKIKKPTEERNITDLSYFHVPYIKKNIRGLEDQVRIAKVFFKAQGVYGAETYVKGFSGYSLELLIIYYKSFLKMLKELSRGDRGQRLVLDIAKHYKRKNDVFIELNEAKLNSPVILVDPTYKERNALAALSFETFYRFQEAAKKFLKNPSDKFFVKKELDLRDMKKKARKEKAEFLHLLVYTHKQSGDIAGTKLKKFSDMLIKEIGKYYKVLDYKFEYPGEQRAEIYLIVKSRGEVVRIGPPTYLKKFVRAFEKEHVKTYIKNKMVHAKIKVKFSAKKYVDVWRKTNKDKIEDMSIEKIVVV